MESSKVLENTYPNDSFHNIIYKISEHQYKTPDYEKYKDVSNNWLKGLKNEMIKTGATGIFMVPAGSLAVGLPEQSKNSDIDCRIYYAGDECNTVELSDIVRPYNHSVKVDDIYIDPSFCDYDKILDEMDSDLKHGSNIDAKKKYASWYMVFAPSLNESKDGKEREVIDSVRKKIITILANTPEGPKIWDIISEYLWYKFIRYDTDPLLGIIQRRRDHIDGSLDRVITERFDGDQRRVNRAKEFIGKQRLSLNYPPFEDMKTIFNVA